MVVEKEQMNLSLQVMDGDKPLKVTMQEVREYLCPIATDNEMYLLLGICKSYGLNPFKREVHIIKYDAKSHAQIVVGYDVYIKRAERTKLLNGWNVDSGTAKIMEVDGKEKVVPVATIDIWRKDWDKPFHWTVRLDQFNKKQSTWNQIPDFMGKKVAIAQGFRLAFPDELGGMPYTPEEAEVYDLQNKDKAIEAKVVTEAPKTVDEVKKAAEATPAPAPENKIPLIEGKVTKIEPHKYKSGKFKTDYSLDCGDNGLVVIAEWKEPNKAIVVGGTVKAVNVTMGKYKDETTYTAESIGVDVQM